MLTIDDYKDVLENISTPLIVALPLYDDKHTIYDFEIKFVNAALIKELGTTVNEGYLFSDFKAKLTQDVQWAEMAHQAIDTHQSVCNTFYSLLCNKWLKAVMNVAGEKNIAITLTDISKDKENEQQLMRQNFRLASLTDELSLSRASLRNKLDSIQTLNQQLHFAAYHDTLTNMNNRAWFTKSVQKAEDESAKSGKKFGIILLDIDNMRDINESRGHHEGDHIIRQCATTLRKFEQDNIIPFRFGGDEFILLYTGIEGREEMEELAKQVHVTFNNTNISISGGIAMYPDDSTVSEDLLKFADMAKTEVKKNGKNQIFFFHQIMQEKFLAKLNIETKLSKAMADKVFQLYFQPQFDIASGELRGFEALLRWHDDELGWISPEQFIPLAEETNLVIPIGDWVMDQALTTLSKWEKDFDFKGQISVNVSPVQFKQSDFMSKLREKIESHAIDVAHLEIEITEGMLIDNMEETVQKLNEIRSMGIGLSLDDFGTGYSSLRYLQILPLTTLKIDKSFISNISEKNGIEANITESIVAMVSKMGLDTIAEGVETTDQLNMLKKFNCHTVQGFLKGKPMPSSLCERVLGGDESAILTIANDTSVS